MKAGSVADLPDSGVSDDTSKGEFMHGCGLVLWTNVLALTVLVIAAGAIGPLSGIAVALMVLIGLVQLLYLVPIGLRLRARGHSYTLQGLITGAAITFLLSATCFGMLGGFSRFSI